MMLYLLIAVLLLFTALLAVHKCASNSVMLMSFTCPIYAKVSAQMQTTHWNMPCGNAVCVF